jgi:hypothetical protein
MNEVKTVEFADKFSLYFEDVYKVQLWTRNTCFLMMDGLNFYLENLGPIPQKFVQGDNHFFDTNHVFYK